MEVDPRDGGLSYLLATKKGAWKRREQAFMSIIRREVCKGDFVCEMGANIGFVTVLLCKLVGQRGRVLAFEPDTRSRSALHRNLRCNGFTGRVFVDGRLLYSSSGRVKFFQAGQPNLSRVSSKGSHSVKSISLDGYMEGEEDLPRLYKMDVEGSEAEIILGGLGVFKRSCVGTKILMEIHPGREPGVETVASAVRRLVELGYVFKYVVSAGARIPPLFKELGYKPDGSFSKYGLSDSYGRAIFSDVSVKDGLILCRPHKWFAKLKGKWSSKVVRSVLLEKV